MLQHARDDHGRRRRYYLHSGTLRQFNHDRREEHPLPEGTHAKNSSYMRGYISSTDQCGTKMPAIATTPLGENDLSPVLQNVSFILYPNPTSGKFTLEQKEGRNFDRVLMEVYSMQGDRVMTGSMDGARSKEFWLPDLQHGLYFVKVSADGYLETFKLVKTR